MPTEESWEAVDYLGAFTRKAPACVPQLTKVRAFLVENVEFAPTTKRLGQFNTTEYWEAIAVKFASARKPRKPKIPTTVADPLVSTILQHYFQVEGEELSRIAIEHSLSMASEGIVGELLERYIASKLENRGWVWCSGEVVKKIDFLGFHAPNLAKAVPIQIKNRDNSENSSSSSVREGTEIVKWFRTFSRTGNTNWENFPLVADMQDLSERDFQEFAREYLKKMVSNTDK